MTNIRKNVPRQTNDCDCGIFTILYADRVLHNSEINDFQQEDIDYDRSKIITDHVYFETQDTKCIEKADINKGAVEDSSTKRPFSHDRIAAIDSCNTIINHGNTCYFNSILQVLVHCQDFLLGLTLHVERKKCLHHKMSSDTSIQSTKLLGTSRRIQSNRKHSGKLKQHKFCITCELNTVLKSICSITCESPLSIELFIDGFRKNVQPTFRKGIQQDAHECFKVMMRAIEEGCVSSIPKRLFNGITITTKTCTCCKNASTTEEEFQELSFTMKCTLQECFQEYTSIEKLD
jgi:ubiquitin C-terminal hydrolase